MRHLLPFNKALRLLLATNALILISSAMFGPIYALFVDSIGGDLLDAGLAGGVFALAAGITTLTSGKITDRIKEKELVVIFGYVALGIGFLAYIAVNSLISLLLVQIIIGFGEAVYSPAFDALYSQHVTQRKAGVQWGAWESMYYFTTAAGSVFGGSIAAVFGFNPLFLLMALLCFGSAAHIYHTPRSML